MTLLDVKAILPHRNPMLLVDRVLHYVEGECLVAAKTIAPAEQGTYATLPENAGNINAEYPVVLVLESWCQAAGILATAHRPSPDVLQSEVMLVSSVTNARPYSPVLPGDVIEHRVRLVRALDDALVFDGDVRVADGRIVLTVERLVMTMRPVTSLFRPETREHEEIAND
jgi:3-hydroxyacyl-[acyl-carrier-protein] dehydratase